MFQKMRRQKKKIEKLALLLPDNTCSLKHVAALLFEKPSTFTQEK